MTQKQMEIRANAMVQALSIQRQQALDQCVILAGDLAIAKARIAEREQVAPHTAPKKKK